MNKKYLFWILLVIFFIIGLYLRLYHIEFGLPHSFYADEPEIVEPAIKYTYEFRDIFFNWNLYKLIPVNFVYGALPSYIFTAAIMFFSKASGLLGLTFDKMSLYVFSRSLNAITSMAIPVVGAFLYNRLFRDRLGTLITFILLSINWKLMVHAHYVNADVFQSIFILISILFFYYYYKKEEDTKFTVLSGLFYGFALGTKITTLVTLPLYAYIFLVKKNFRNFVAFCFIIFGVYILTNPFSWAFPEDFIFRMLQLRVKEAGLVFDSVDTGLLKYPAGLSFIITVPVFMFSLYGIFLNFKSGIKKADKFLLFLIGHLILYLVFFSLQDRRVDRWLLPVLPITVIYAAFGLSYLRKYLDGIKTGLTYALIGVFNLYYVLVLLFQFQKDTPKSAAYRWMQQNTPEMTWKLVYTEEGLDPMNKIKFADVYKYNVYSSDNARFFLPQDPFLYDYVVLSSRPMQNYKKPIIRKTYPFYYEKWNDFENKVLDSNNFILLKEFTLIKPNLIPLSDVYIYKNVNSALRDPPKTGM